LGQAVKGWQWQTIGHLHGTSEEKSFITLTADEQDPDGEHCRPVDALESSHTAS